jgi:hypothetical protein
LQLNDVRTLTVADEVTLDAPGIYTWTIEGVGVYVGKFTRKSRPLLEYNRNVDNLLGGRPYRKSKPDGFRTIHQELANAVVNGLPIWLRIVENCIPADLNNRERQIINALAQGGLNGTK